MKSLFSILFTALLVSCSAQEKSDQDITMADVTNDEAKELITQHPDLQIIDVRQNAEVANGIIDGAIQMDISKPAFDSQIETLDKEKPVLVYCAGGGRSKTAQEIMEEAGFKTVYNLKRGYERWE